MRKREDSTNLLAVDGLSTCSIAPGKVTTLQHEALDAPVEARPGISELNAGFVGLVSDTKMLKVVGSLQKTKWLILAGFMIARTFAPILNVYCARLLRQ